MLTEDELGRLQALQTMQRTAQQLQQQRQDQGFSLTSVNLRLQQCGASMAPNGQLVRAVRLQLVKASMLPAEGGAVGLNWPSTGLDCASSSAGTALLALLCSRSGHYVGGSLRVCVLQLF